MGVWTGSGWLRVKKNLAGTCDYGNEPSGYIECGEFLRIAKNRLASQEGL